MPSSHLILCRSLLLLPPIPPSIRVFPNESTLRMRWPKDWSFRRVLFRSIKPRSPALQADSLPSEPPAKPKTTGVGSLSLLQIFPTQESNWGLLHCRRILYQLSYRGSPGKFPDQGSNQGAWHGEPRVLVTGLPGKLLTMVNIFAYVLYIPV